MRFQTKITEQQDLKMIDYLCLTSFISMNKDKKLDHLANNKENPIY